MSYYVSYKGNMTPEEFKALLGPLFYPSIILSLIISVILIIALWKLFEKADEPGWKCLIPFYNAYIEFKIACGNGWMFLLLFIPFVNICVSIWFAIQLAKAFGQPGVFAVGLILLSPIFYSILGFGNSTYVGPKGIPADM